LDRGQNVNKKMAAPKHRHPSFNCSLFLLISALMAAAGAFALLLLLALLTLPRLVSGLALLRMTGLLLMAAMLRVALLFIRH
jgi:hypothetical protein